MEAFYDLIIPQIKNSVLHNKFAILLRLMNSVNSCFLLLSKGCELDCKLRKFYFRNKKKNVAIAYFTNRYS